MTSSLAIPQPSSARLLASSRRFFSWLTKPLHVKINKLERGGFGNLWDSIISSLEVGVQKPDPKIYQLALQQLGITSNQAVFVGHKAIELEGARNVGMKTVAFNYDKDAKADYYIKKFSDLVNLPVMS
jgi:FMN phosphatase YigB (HAD superfamily)